MNKMEKGGGGYADMEIVAGTAGTPAEPFSQE
jgi:hypothetical protein